MSQKLSAMERANKRARHLAAQERIGRRGDKKPFLVSKRHVSPKRPSTTKSMQLQCPYYENGGIASDGNRCWSEEEKNKPMPVLKGRRLTKAYSVLI